MLDNTTTHIIMNMRDRVFTKLKKQQKQLVTSLKKPCTKKWVKQT